MAIKVPDVCVEFFNVSSYVFQVGVHVLQFCFHVVCQLPPANAGGLRRGPLAGHRAAI